MNPFTQKNFWSSVLCILTITLACKKQDLQSDQRSQPERIMGALPDDPKKLSTVPLIVSQTFYHDTYSLRLLKRPATGGGKGNSGNSTSDVTSPTVNITSPHNGAGVTGTISVTVSASDDKGVTSVSLSVDGNVIATTSTSPYIFSWNTSSATTGSHTLTAKAIDAAGNWSSYSISVTVNTTIIPLPPPSSGFSLLMPPVAIQGSEGSCAAFAIGYAARSAEELYKTSSITYSYSANIFSPEYLYNQTKISDNCSSGSSVLTALDFLKNNGICTWGSMPYSSSNGCSLMPTAFQTAEAGNFKISSYKQIYTSDLPAIKAALQAGHALIISFMVDSYFYNAGPGFIWKSFSGTNVGRHAVVICGYDDEKKAVKVFNSWGTAWGESGYSWIDYGFLPSVNSIVFVMNM